MDAEAKKAYMRQWRAANKERRSAYAKAYYVANGEIIRANVSAWTRENKGSKNATCMKRKAAKLQRTPSWANLDKIAEMYELAQFATEESGAQYHVDHIIPLQGAKVSGLHVYENLRVIPAKENLRKHNKHDI